MDMPQSLQFGFTLLEVMIAVAVIAMSLVSLLGSQSQSISIASISRFETTASMLARQKLTELQIENFEDLSNGSGAFEDEFADYSWRTEVTELTEDDTGIEGSDGLLKMIELQVNRAYDENMVFTVRSLVMAKVEPAEEK